MKFPGSQMVRTWHFHCQGQSFIPAWGTKILKLCGVAKNQKYVSPSEMTLLENKNTCFYYFPLLKCQFLTAEIICFLHCCIPSSCIHCVLKKCLMKKGRIQSRGVTGPIFTGSLYCSRYGYALCWGYTDVPDGHDPCLTEHSKGGCH